MPLNILVVDDSAVMRSIIKKTLALSGVAVGEVLEAGNGREGLDVLEANWIDIALIDIHMPVMDGEEMIRRIRHNPENQNLPVIIVSSESDQHRIDMLQREGTSFVHKPFTPETLREVIIEVTGASHERTD
jgi:two-component system, chemotaxis family, chemotaxis protein CheY